MKKLISRRNFLAAMGTVAAAGVLTACGGSSSGTASSAAASSTAVLPAVPLLLLRHPARLPLLRRAGVM